MTAHTRADWERLGALLQDRRVGLDSRYKNRSLFATERGIDYRLAYDVETGARVNYRRPTLRAIESAYALEPGSIDSVLAGAPLARIAQSAERRQEPAPAPEAPARPVYADPRLERLARSLEDPDLDLSPEERDAFVGMAAAMIRRREREERTRGAG